MKKTAITFLVTAALALPLAGQELSLQQEATILYDQMSTDSEMKTTKKVAAPFTVDWGGWITPVLIDERKGSETTSAVISTKLWASSNLWGNTSLYIRGKDMLLLPVADNGTPVEQDHVIDLDAAFIAIKNNSGTIQLYTGRKFYNLGTGLVFNGRGDGAEFRFYSPVIDVKFFSIYTGFMQKEANPYNLSSTDFSDGAKRLFNGLSLEKMLGRHTVYLFGLLQTDMAEEDNNTKSRYQSQYFGGGLKGILFDGFDYYGEFVYETGTSYLSGTTTEKPVRAMAAMTGFNYYADMAFNPAFLFQYAYGSGDADRTGGSDATGNTSGDDNGFIYFGTFVGGYALRPVLYNLHIFRPAVAAAPFYKSNNRYIKTMNIIARYNYYMKANSKGTVSDGEAGINSSDVGHGIDLSLRWKPWYDLSFFINYGLFIPGGAYASSEENRNFVMTGFTLVF